MTEDAELHNRNAMSKIQTIKKLYRINDLASSTNTLEREKNKDGEL